MGRFEMEEIKQISGSSPHKCIRCGRCSASCPISDSMDYLPHRFVSLLNDNEEKLLIESEAPWMCLSCFACEERCPKDVKPGRILDAVRQISLRAKGGGKVTVESVSAAASADMPQQLVISALRKAKKS